MTTLAKQVVSVLFGATDQDTSKKAVKLGDLVTAENVVQVKGGEFSKRDGFTATEQTYIDRESIMPDAFCAPDGTVKLVRDSLDDVAFAQGAAGGTWKSLGGTQRLMVKDHLRFHSTSSAEQVAPMAKQAGDFFVWLDDESHVRYAQQDPDGTRLARISDPVLVAGPTAGSGESSHIKSFALVNDVTFDADNLWIYWVDWTWNEAAQQNRNGVWAMKIPKDFTLPTQYCVAAGTANNRYILTGITATVIGGVCYTAQCGIYTGTGDAVQFRSAGAMEMDGWAQHMTVDNTGTAGVLHSYLRTSTSRAWCASGICWLSSAGNRYVTDHLYYAFWTQHLTDRTKCDLVLVDVTVSTGDTTGIKIASIDLTTEAKPATFTVNHTFVGQVTGREYDGGCYVIGSVRATNSIGSDGVITDINTTVKADRVYTRCYTCTTGGGTIRARWTARGAWLAHGIFKWSGSASEYIITGWHDADEVQLCYHLRELDTGKIVCQFLYGNAAFAGGCGSSYAQLTQHVSDLQQPYLLGSQYSAILPTASANVDGSCDISTIEVYRPTYQQPAPVRGLALAPGGIPTIAGGWQNVQEAGPLTAPSLVQSFYGSGSS